MSESSPLPPRRRPWAFSFFGLLTAGGLVAMVAMAGPPDGAKMPDLVRFSGHFHPVLLHLPIGILVLVLLQELGAMFRRRAGGDGRRSPVFPMFLASATATLAVIAGFLLYHGGGYEGNALAERHLWGGLAFAVMVIFTAILRAWSAAPDGNPALFRLFLLLSAGVMGLASHDGASLTHGEQYLTEYAPAPLREWLGMPPKAAPQVKPMAERIVYADIVAPILEQRCVQCHRDGKAKGGVRMDSFEMLAKGGKRGPVIQPGNAAQSTFIKLVELPVDDIDHMPPEGKPPLTPAETAVIKWWIDQGADPNKTIRDHTVPPEIQTALNSLEPAGGTATGGTAATGLSPHPTSTGPDAALTSSVAALAKEFPGSVTFESQQSPLVTLTAASMRGTLDDAAFAKFAPVLAHLVSADLSGTKLTDAGVATLAPAKNLRLIRLAEVPVTDASVEALLKLGSLESVNLYGTKITDAGALKLAALPKLKRLYLWQTAVTPATVAALKAKLPQCEIVTGS